MSKRSQRSQYVGLDVSLKETTAFESPLSNLEST